MIKHIKECRRLEKINKIIYKDDMYEGIRRRCNNHVHQNSHYHFFINNPNYFFDKRTQVLNAISSDISDLFVWHFVNFFYLKDVYLSSIETVSICAGEPGWSQSDAEEALRSVPSFIQNTFEKYVKSARSDLANELLKRTSTDLT